MRALGTEDRNKGEKKKKAKQECFFRQNDNKVGNEKELLQGLDKKKLKE